MGEDNFLVDTAEQSVLERTRGRVALMRELGMSHYREDSWEATLGPEPPVESSTQPSSSPEEQQEHQQHHQ